MFLFKLGNNGVVKDQSKKFAMRKIVQEQFYMVVQNGVKRMLRQSN